MKNFFLSLIVLAFFTLTGCTKVKVKGEGPVTQQARQVEAFTKLKASENIKIEFTVGPETKISVEAQENLVDLIKTDSQKGVLVLNTQGDLVSKEDLKVYITAPALQQIVLGGNSVFTATNNVQVEEMTLETAGKSKVKMQINASEISLKCSGDSQVALNGFVDDLKAEVSGNSKLFALKLAAIKARVEGSGNANLKLFVKKDLKAEASGSSKIVYKGSPKKDFGISGTASIDKK